MRTRLFNPILLALAVLFAQWVGMAHRVEHHKQLERSIHQSSERILHNCLVFDALSTAHTPTCNSDPTLYTPQLSLIGKANAQDSLRAAHNTDRRVRVRDPPVLS